MGCITKESRFAVTKSAFDRECNMKKSFVINELHQLGYSGLLNHLQTINKETDKRNTYHTTNHCINVTYRSLMLLEMLGKSNSIIQTPLTKRILIIAALFHDAGHLGSLAKTDQENVEIAQSHILNIQGVPKHILEKAAASIATTVYPFVVPPSNEIEYILRDADGLASVDYDGPMWALNLFEEIRNRFGMSIVEFLHKQEEFLNGTQSFLPAMWNHASKSGVCLLPPPNKQNRQTSLMVLRRMVNGVYCPTIV